jgi:hypothetical protein
MERSDLILKFKQDNLSGSRRVIDWSIRASTWNLRKFGHLVRRFKPRHVDVESLIKNHALDYDTKRWSVSNQSGWRAGHGTRSAIEERKVEGRRNWRMAISKIYLNIKLAQTAHSPELVALLAFEASCRVCQKELRGLFCIRKGSLHQLKGQPTLDVPWP